MGQLRVVGTATSIPILAPLLIFNHRHADRFYNIRCYYSYAFDRTKQNCSRIIAVVVRLIKNIPTFQRSRPRKTFTRIKVAILFYFIFSSDLLLNLYFNPPFFRGIKRRLKNASSDRSCNHSCYFVSIPLWRLLQHINFMPIDLFK